MFTGESLNAGPSFSKVSKTFHTQQSRFIDRFSVVYIPINQKWHFGPENLPGFVEIGLQESENWENRFNKDLAHAATRIVSGNVLFLTKS